MSNVLYVKKKITLNSSQNVCQYLDPEREKLITMIGEFHEDSFKCSGDTMDISEYCRNRLEENKNCLVLLEYNSSYQSAPFNINSVPIRELSKENRYKNRIKGWDTRWKYLNGNKGQTTLYYEELHDNEELERQFMKPLKKIFLEKGQKYSKKERLMLQNYEQKLKKDIQKLSLSSKVLQEKLRNIWMCVSDYEILKKILGSTGYDEIVIVAGKYHLDNLCPFFSHYFQKIHTSNIKSSNSCGTVYVPNTIKEILS